MINLETWLPSNYGVNGRGWNVKDIGALGTGGRYVDLRLIKIPFIYIKSIYSQQLP